MQEENRKEERENSEMMVDTDWQSLAEERLSGWRRALADYENLRRDSQEQQQRAATMSKLHFALEFLNFFDNFLTALEHIPADVRTSAWAVGLDHVKRQGDELIRGLGLLAMNTATGQTFDHQKHEAVETVNLSDQADQQITKVISDGYMLGQEVVRPARVVVNSKN